MRPLNEVPLNFREREYPQEKLEVKGAFLNLLMTSSVKSFDNCLFCSTTYLLPLSRNFQEVNPRLFPKTDLLKLATEGTPAHTQRHC